MKKDNEKKILQALSKLVMATAEKEADSACFLFSYQPKMPDELKKVKR